MPDILGQVPPYRAGARQRSIEVEQPRLRLVIGSWRGDLKASGTFGSLEGLKYA
jgi:hypothetical protein